MIVKKKLLMKKKQQLKKINGFKSLIYVMVVFVLLLSIGYSSFNKSLNITGTVLQVRTVAEIRVTNVEQSEVTNGAVANLVDYNKDRLLSSVSLPNSNSTITYKISVTNIGNSEMAIKTIKGLPSNLTYSLKDYTLREKICDSNNKCTAGITKEFYITIKYSSYDSTSTSYNLNVVFEFAQIFNITYTNLDNMDNGQTGYGAPVYFDVSEGTACSQLEYEMSYDSTIGDYLNSKTGYNGLTATKTDSKQNSCLKFYVVKNDSTTTVDLILDHNTTESSYWANADTTTSASGPIDALTNLNNDTSSWNGTITPSNYTTTRTTNNYTINYSNYKARMITAQEVANITGNTWFNESTTAYTEDFYFENDGVDYKTLTLPSTGINHFGWLFDRTYKRCDAAGCYNNSIGDTKTTVYGYWTSTPINAVTNVVWNVHCNGKLTPYYVNYIDARGIRPVITVSRTDDLFPSSTTILEGDYVNLNLGKYYPYQIEVTSNGNSIEYKYIDGNLTIQNASGNIHVKALEYKEAILNGSVPIYSTMNLTPVYYDGSNWRVYSKYQKWYSYAELKWANAVMLKSGVTKSVGDIVNVDGFSSNSEVYGMYVWIPRYEYKIDGKYGLGGTSADLPGEIEVNFISKSTLTASSGYRVHPGFEFGTSHLSGIWIGKFETSHETLSSSTSSNNTGCSDTNCANADGLRVVPNVQSLRYNKVQYFFNAARSMTRSGNVFGLSSNNVDTHMTDNTEWAAMAYLSQSKYGKYANSSYSASNKEIYMNNSSSFYTGKSLGTPAVDGAAEVAQGTYSYDQQTVGTGASTTGNIFGIYDVSGGANEYAMAVYNKSSGSSGFSSSTFPDEKYYNNYTSNDLSEACDGGTCYGHALSETSTWYGDYENPLNWMLTWTIRGGNYSLGAQCGPFFYGAVLGQSYSHYSFRLVLAPVE